MDVKIRGGILQISHKLKENELYKFSKSSRSQSVKVYKTPQIVKGFSNVCSDLKGIVIIDYDEVEEEIVIEDWNYIQKKFKLPPAYLFMTKQGNYHVICLFKALQSTIYEILTNTRCDINFKSMPLRNPYRSYVLRIGEKQGSKRPKFLRIIGNHQNLSKEISSAHLKLLSKFYPLPKINYLNKDNLKKIKIHTYETN